MPRKETSRVDSDSDSSDTDSDVDYELGVDDAAEICNSHDVSTTAVEATYKSQRGLCRITNIPFGQGLYAPTVAPRRTMQPVSDDNMILVVCAMQAMRQSVNLPWRPFVHLIRMMASDAEL
tara:strand:+ start:106 stop:468 length:363 start_codon:yes stop_codon:yes gene_type:complete